MKEKNYCINIEQLPQTIQEELPQEEEKIISDLNRLGLAYSDHYEIFLNIDSPAILSEIERLFNWETTKNTLQDVCKTYFKSEKYADKDKLINKLIRAGGDTKTQIMIEKLFMKEYKEYIHKNKHNIATEEMKNLLEPFTSKGFPHLIFVYKGKISGPISDDEKTWRVRFDGLFPINKPYPITTTRIELLSNAFMEKYNFDQFSEFEYTYFINKNGRKGRCYEPYYDARYYCSFGKVPDVKIEFEEDLDDT